MVKIGLTDSPATQDSFGIEGYISGLSDFILQCDTPMTISIQGSWGSGKTSIMNMVQNRIKDKVITVFFNTWQFSQFSLGNALPISMINFFISQLAGDTPEKRNAFFKSLPKYGAYALSFLINNVVRLQTGGWLPNLITKDHVEKIFSFGSNKREDDPTKVNEQIAASAEDTFNLAQSIIALKNVLQESVNKSCSDQNKDRVVVFIDDLDRLVPSKAMELLEVLKIFFDCNNCVFVLAIDYDVVIRGAAEKYGFNLNDHTPQGRREAEKGRAFFDKIIQVPFKVPVVEYDIRAYLEDGLKKINIKPNDKDMSKYQRLCALSLGTNPRGLKRLLNAFLLLNKVRPTQSDEEKSEDDKSKRLLILFGLLCMQQYKENIYNLVVKVNKGITSDAHEALKLISLLSDGSSESIERINKTYRTDILEDDVAGFVPFFEDFLEIINIEPQSISFMLDEDSEYTEEQQKIIDNYTDNYMLLNELLKLSATTATDDVSSTSVNISNFNETQLGRYKFWCALKNEALKSEDFKSSGLRFSNFKDDSWLGFAIGSSKVILAIRQSRRINKCSLLYYFKKSYYKKMYQIKDQIEDELQLKLNWDDPQVNQKQISARYDIDNVNFNDEEQMMPVYHELIEKIVKFKNCILKHM